MNAETRPTPRNLTCEPPYPGAEHVVMLSLKCPDLTMHRSHPDCGRSDGHLVAECGVFLPAPQGEESGGSGREGRGF